MFSNALKSLSSNIASKYSLSPTPSSQSGPWKIYDAKNKKTGQPYSVFVFERKGLASANASDTGLSLRGSSSRDGTKAAQEEVVERLRHEAGLLARLRHPCVLELVEPVEETRAGGLQFATEPVICSLGTLLAEKDDDERGSSRYVKDESGARRRRREVDIDELEIQKGLEQLGKALEFLHESANLIHGNLTPEAVMVNAKSDWKICGLGFAVSNVKPPLPPGFDPRLPPCVQLNLDYAAPDMVLDHAFTTSCDMFSLGLLVVALYNRPHRSPLETHGSNSTYRRLLSAASTTPTASNGFLSQRPLPRQLTASLLPQLITRRAAGRLSAREFQQSDYFDNILVSTLRFLDNLPAKTPSEKQAFMRGLVKVLPQFPRSVLEKKILPGLVEELRDGSMLALVLPNIFQIAESASSRLFSEKVLRRLKEVFIPAGGAAPTPSSEPKTAAAKIAEREREAGKEGGLTVILSRLPLIKEKTTAREFKEDILPLVFLALESPTHALQDLALRSLPVVLPKLDFPTLKNELFPVVSAVFTKTSSLGIKIRGLEAFRVLCGGVPTSSTPPSDGLDGAVPAARKPKEDAPVLDKYTIQERVIPLLQGIKTKEPAVTMETLAVFTEIGQVCDREVVAMEILPTLWTMSFGPLLGLDQFRAFMSTITRLSQKIEQEQIRKLSELASSDHAAANGAAAGAGDFLSFGGAPGMHAMAAASGGGGGEADSFEALVFGSERRGGAAADNGGFDWSSSANGNASSRTVSRTGSPAAGGGGMRSPLATSSAAAAAQKAKFSWSSPSPTMETPTTMAALKPAVPARSSTPSSSSSTATAAAGLSGLSMAPLQPASGIAGFGSTTALRPASISTPTSTSTSASTPPPSGTSLDWSAATKKPAFPSNPPKPSNTTTTTASASSFPALKPQTNRTSSSPSLGAAGGGGSGGGGGGGGSQATILYGQTRTTSSAGVTASAGEFRGFGLPPPPPPSGTPKPTGGAASTLGGLGSAQSLGGLNFSAGSSGGSSGMGMGMGMGMGGMGGMASMASMASMGGGGMGGMSMNAMGMGMGMSNGANTNTNGMGMGGMAGAPAHAQPSAPAKQGLDKWESLL